ncbi:MAG: hypothetical protein EOO88_07970 [Pedobacter sp.]|nr:MAG: hypothetical protein EOO88_07970 [Pedobacter sp.]
MNIKIQLTFAITLVILIVACTGKTIKQKIPSSVDSTKKNEDTTAKIIGDTVQTVEQPAKYEGSLHKSTGLYIDIDANGDNELLIVAQGKDTLYYILESSSDLKLQRGDSIRVSWRNGSYRPAGDPEYPVKATFALEYGLIKPGKLSTALKAGMPKINYYYYDDQTSDYAKGMVHNAVKYYLVSTAQPDIRAEMDNNKRNLLYTVERKTIKDREAWVISIHVDGVKPQPIHSVYLFFETPYTLYDYVP